MDFQTKTLNGLNAAKLYIRILGAAALVALALLCQYTWADTVYLKSGSKIKGVVVSESANEVIIKMDQGMIALDRTEIRRINKDPSSVLGLAGGTETGTRPGSEAQASAASKARSEAIDDSIRWLVRLKNSIELRLGTPLTMPVCILFFIAILLLFLLFAVWQKNGRLLAENQDLREKFLSPGQKPGK